MKTTSIATFVTSGCSLADTMPVRAFAELYRMANNDPCKGCTMPCELKSKLNDREKRVTKTGSSMTNKQIADNLGISKRQVAKMRAAGTLLK